MLPISPIPTNSKYICLKSCSWDGGVICKANFETGVKETALAQKAFEQLPKHLKDRKD